MGGRRLFEGVIGVFLWGGGVFLVFVEVFFGKSLTILGGSSILPL